MGHFNRKALVKHPLVFAINIAISAIEQKFICNVKFTRFWEIENSNKKENFSMSEFIRKVEFNGQKYETLSPGKPIMKCTGQFFISQEPINIFS